MSADSETDTGFSVNADEYIAQIAAAEARGEAPVGMTAGLLHALRVANERESSSKDRERVGRPSHMYQPFISEARHTPRVEKALDPDPFETVAAYNAAWDWAYEAARIAYAAGREHRPRLGLCLPAFGALRLRRLHPAQSTRVDARCRRVEHCWCRG